jgi:hypothetical protein
VSSVVAEAFNNSYLAEKHVRDFRVCDEVLIDHVLSEMFFDASSLNRVGAAALC